MHVLNSVRVKLQQFSALESAAGILLVLSTVVAMILANSAAQELYFHCLHVKILGLSVHHWVNDGLMTIFFFMIGMEIKKEIMVGELAQPKKAALPIAAAIGGMLVPALIYVAFNPLDPNRRGWGIPMATDIAFALGALTFFGKRVPLPLKVFLLALAIIDDLGAVIVIALFYTSQIVGPYLGLAAIGLGAIALLKRVGVRHYWIYVTLGAVVWFGVLKSGVHATVAGVLVGLLTPLAFPKYGKAETYSPLDDLVHTLHPWVNFAIMPIFALCNAGIALAGVEMLSILKNPIHQGVLLGLAVGKPVGILLISFIVVRMGLARLPARVGWMELLGVGLLAGIGFTMALFISGLALYPEQEIYSKTAILLASMISAVAGMVVLKTAFSRARP